MQKIAKTSVSRARLTWLVALVALVVAAVIPTFTKSDYYLDILIVTMVYAVLSMTFIMQLKSGLISLGIAAFWGIGAYSAAILTTKMGLSFWAALPLSALLTAFVAFLLGFLIIGRGGVFTFVILTAVVGMLFSVSVGASSYLGNYAGISNIPAPNTVKIPGLPAWDFLNKSSWYYLALILVVVVAVVCFALYKSWIGRAWTSIGLNTKLAASIGVNVFRYRLLGFVIASGIAGLIGAFYASYMVNIDPSQFSTWSNIYLQLYAILGGIQYAIAGPILGSLIMNFLPEAFRSIPDYAPLVTGALLILLILFLPNGILGLLPRGTTGLTGIRENVARVGRFFSRSGERADGPGARGVGGPVQGEPQAAIQAPVTGDDSAPSSTNKADER